MALYGCGEADTVPPYYDPLFNTGKPEGEVISLTVKEINNTIVNHSLPAGTAATSITNPLIEIKFSSSVDSAWIIYDTTVNVEYESGVGSFTTISHVSNEYSAIPSNPVAANVSLSAFRIDLKNSPSPIALTSGRRVRITLDPTIEAYADNSVKLTGTTTFYVTIHTTLP